MALDFNHQIQRILYGMYHKENIHETEVSPQSITQAVYRRL